jgi:hypothetical protein
VFCLSLDDSQLDTLDFRSPLGCGNHRGSASRPVTIALRRASSDASSPSPQPTSKSVLPTTAPSSSNSSCCSNVSVIWPRRLDRHRAYDSVSPAIARFVILGRRLCQQAARPQYRSRRGWSRVQG